jgi:hypothetical protein
VLLGDPGAELVVRADSTANAPRRDGLISLPVTHWCSSLPRQSLVKMISMRKTNLVIPLSMSPGRGLTGQKREQANGHV